MGVVRKRDGLVLVRKAADHRDRAEDLLPHDLHPRLDVGEDRRRDEVAAGETLAARTLAAGDDLAPSSTPDAM